MAIQMTIRISWWSDKNFWVQKSSTNTTNKRTDSIYLFQNKSPVVDKKQPKLEFDNESDFWGLRLSIPSRVFFF